jgi:hypothetical protein
VAALGNGGGEMEFESENLNMSLLTKCTQTIKIMERVHLTKIEKKVFKAIEKNSINNDLLTKLSEAQVTAAVKSLSERGFVECRINYGKVVDAKLTFSGQAYKNEFKTLRNKLTESNKWVIATIISVITLVLAFFGSIYNK